MNTIQMNLFDYFYEDDSFTVKDATEVINNVKNMQVNNESVRAGIYEGVERGIFTKISRGVYQVKSQIQGKETKCLLIIGDGRDLSAIPDKSIDGIVTDHPYLLTKSLKGGNRNFAEYELFRYEKNDFVEKQRVLKDGAFLVEFLPEENEDNMEYLYNIKKMAKDAGFRYYSKVSWSKGTFVSNTGRKSSNCEDVMIFSNGKPRELRLNQKRNLQIARENNLDVKGKSSYEVRDILEKHGLEIHYMSGTSKMLPTAFDYQPAKAKEKIHSAEKPVELLEDIIHCISKPYELLLDQFGGSGNFAIASLNTNRNVIVIEKDEETYDKMKENILNNSNDTVQEDKENTIEIEL